jgi:hypothetical protein
MTSVIVADLTAAEVTEARALRDELLSLRSDLYGVGCGQAALNEVRDLLALATQWDAASEAARVEADSWRDLLARAEAGALVDTLPASEPEPTPSYRYRVTLYDRITVNGELQLTHYHVYEPVNPTPHQSNVFIPVARPTDAGDWADAQDCYGNKLSAQNAPQPTPPAPIAISERAHTKASDQIARGIRIVRLSNGDTLVPSGSQVGIVYRVRPTGQCDCQAGAKGRACWHLAAVRQLAAEPVQIAA